MVKEVWTHDTPYGTETAALYTYGEGDYFVDMHCILWNRHYKSYAWAKKYLEKCGYEHSATVVKLG
jgi:hypothetical protein